MFSWNSAMNYGLQNTLLLWNLIKDFWWENDIQLLFALSLYYAFRRSNIQVAPLQPLWNNVK